MYIFYARSHVMAKIFFNAICTAHYRHSGHDGCGGGAVKGKD